MPRTWTFIAQVVALSFLLTSAAPSLLAAQNAPAQPNQEVVALLTKGREASVAHRFSEALRLYNEALEKSRALKDKPGEAITLGNLGFIYAGLGQLQKALEFLQQALPVQRALQDKPGEAMTLNNIGAIYDELGQRQKALEAYQQALSLRKTLEDKPGQASTLSNIGFVYTEMGQWQKALEVLQQALTLRRAVGDKSGEATTLNNIGGVYSGLGQPQKELEFYQQALTLFREVKNQRGEVATLVNVGGVYANLGQPQKALEFFEQALPLQRAMQNKSGEATTLNNIGRVYKDLEQPQKALDSYQQALSLRRAVGDKPGEATTLSNIGRVYHELGERQKALEFYRQALPLQRAVQDRPGEAMTLNNLGGLYDQVGQPQRALEFYRQALPLFREVENRVGEAATLNNIGFVHATLGQPQKALDFYQQALSLRKTVQDKDGEAVTLNNIGLVYSSLGQPQKALEFYQQVLPLMREVKNRSGEATTLSNIGGVYVDLRQPQKALEFYQQVLPLRRALEDKPGQAIVLNNIGAVYSDLGQRQRALEFYQQALSLHRAVEDRPGEATSLNNIGKVHADLGQRQKALEFFQQALPLQRAVEDKTSQATTLGNIAVLEESLGRFAAANRNYLAGLAILEDLRTSLGGLSEAKVSFLEKNIPLYHAYINLLLKQNNPIDALAWTQKGKARSLLDLMQNGKVDLSQGLSDEEKQQVSELRLRARRMNDELIAEASKANPDTARLGALRGQLATLESDWQTFQDRLYVRRPNVALNRGARTTSLADIAGFLPKDTALLEYAVLDVRHTVDARNASKTVLFCVTVENGKPAVTAYAINQTRKELVERVGDYQTACADPKKNYETKARDLYNLLLAPAQKQLTGKKRLIVCPDGPLWSLPFHALMASDPATGSRQFVAEQYEVTYAYSATAVDAALRKKADPQRPKPTAALLAFANPDFGDESRFVTLDAGSVRQQVASGGERPIDAGSVRSPLLTLRAGGLKPLPATQQEAEALKVNFPEATIHTRKDAQEATAKQEAGKYRYLHFATHGLFNDLAPLQSGVLLAEPPQGSDEDGLLTAREIFDLTLSADMVVLSACDTASGQRRGGEGMVGLTWALFVAGAPTQIVSQWAVNDASTAELMKRFYVHLKATQGKEKGTALRSAMLELMKDGQHGHPFYWAPFILVGDWR